MKVRIEREMDHVIVKMGGAKVTDYLKTKSPPFDNADYIFRSSNVISELKCLELDRRLHEPIQKKLDAIGDELIQKRLMPHFWGTKELSTQDLPLEYQKRVYKVFSDSVREVVKKANKQIRSTKEHFEMPGAHGLLLLANDGDYSLPPEQFVHTVRMALANMYSSIDTVIMFTVNMAAKIEGSGEGVLVWAIATRPEHPKIDPLFANRLFIEWSRRIEDLTGATIPNHGPFDLGSIKSSSFW